MVTFKNGVDRYWRKNAPNGISEIEKVKLKQDLLSPSLLIEPVNQIASQLAVLISKIARYHIRLNLNITCFYIVEMYVIVTQI